MKPNETGEYLEKIAKLGSRPGLESIRELLERLGNPQNDLRFIHVAGTNGKGSTAGLIGTVLQYAGYRVGKYTSPAVFAYEERYCVNNRSISKAMFARILTEVAEAAEAMEQNGMGHPTVFEVETAVAMLYFRQQGCDYVVLECGMGGALDATNLITTTVACVFTSISMDHMQYLGDTLTAIATQKAGIVKPGGYVVCGIQQDEVRDIIEKRARECSCRSRFVDAAAISGVRCRPDGITFRYGTWKNLNTQLAGEYQVENVSLAVETILALRECGLEIPNRAVYRGIAETSWPGRFTTIAKNPLVIIDGAHNADAAQKLGKQIANHFTNRRIIYIMGMLKDKEADRIVSATCALADCIVTVTTPNNPRALHALDLARLVREYNPNVTAADSIEEAVEMAHLLSDSKSVIIAFGSLSYLGQLKNAVEAYREKNSGRKRGSNSHG